jgi:hypothetical protein
VLGEEPDLELLPTQHVAHRQVVATGVGAAIGWALAGAMDAAG